MQSLFLFIFRYRAFLFFLGLEALCGWLIIRNNYYQSAAFFNSSNHYAAQMLKFSNSIHEYLDLKQVNASLARENARLNSLLYQNKQQFSYPNAIKIPTKDTLVIKKYKFMIAKVINNQTKNVNNFITIDKGTADGIRPGMGVISPAGVVGKVKASSKHFSTIISLLNSHSFVTGKIQKNSAFGPIQWEGTNAHNAKLLNISKHIKLAKGDTIVTSGYGLIFPEDILIGTVNQAIARADETFYEIDINLSTEFDRLTYVYVIDNVLKQEQDSLQQQTYRLGND